MEITIRKCGGEMRYLGVYEQIFKTKENKGNIYEKQEERYVAIIVTIGARI